MLAVRENYRHGIRRRASRILFARLSHCATPAPSLFSPQAFDADEPFLNCASLL
jgi:hypothetical protein